MSDALVPELSDLANAQIAVRPELMRFPTSCLACASTATSLTDVRFTRTLLLGVGGGIETTWLRVPLCDDHRRAYERRMRVITVVQVACVFVVCVAVAVLFMSSDRRPAPEDVQQVAAGVAVAAVVVAYASIGRRATALPVRLSVRQHGRLFAGGYVFTFPDVAAAERFALANVEPPARSGAEG